MIDVLRYASVATFGLTLGLTSGMGDDLPSNPYGYTERIVFYTSVMKSQLYSTVHLGSVGNRQPPENMGSMGLVRTEILQYVCISREIRLFS